MDGYSPKPVERILKIKSNHKNFVHLVGLYTYHFIRMYYDAIFSTYCFLREIFVGLVHLLVLEHYFPLICFSLVASYTFAT